MKTFTITHRHSTAFTFTSEHQARDYSGLPMELWAALDIGTHSFDGVTVEIGVIHA